MNEKDRRILRDCAKQQMEFAASLENLDKIRRWYRHNSMLGEPMVLAEIFGIYEELNLESSLRCESTEAREIELGFRQRFFQHEYIQDDSVIDPFYNIKWNIRESNTGVDVRINRSMDRDGKSFGMEIEAPIKNLEEELYRLKPREYFVDREETYKKQDRLMEIFGDILPVRIHGDYWWTMGLSHHAIYLTGLEKFMLYMYDQPDSLHELMRFIFDDRLAQIKWMEKENLLNMNNGNNYTGSGSRGFTDELAQEGSFVKSTDLWALLESQPTSHVSPAMFKEFVFDYQLEMAGNFGLIYYGCCEPLHDRMEFITTIPNLKSVSVSPYSNENIMAEHIGKKYIYSRKPDPVMLSTEIFNSEDIIKSIENTIRIASGCELEFVMKDLHTVRYNPERLRDWVNLTRQAVIVHQ